MHFFVQLNVIVKSDISPIDIASYMYLLSNVTLTQRIMNKIKSVYIRYTDQAKGVKVFSSSCINRRTRNKIKREVINPSPKNKTKYYFLY